MEQLGATDRTRVTRKRHRALADPDDLYTLLDATFLCHVGFVRDGSPVLLPTCYGREDDRLYLHGSVASGMLGSLTAGPGICVAVTIVDGLVLARAAVSQSVNYRSAVMFGTVTTVDDPRDKVRALRTLTDHVIPGRWAAVRSPDRRELAATSVLAFQIQEASVKARVGAPDDQERDRDAEVWAGVVPLSVVAGTPIPAPQTGP